MLRSSSRLTTLSVIFLGLVLFLGIGAARVSKAQSSSMPKQHVTEAQVLALQNRFQDASVSGDAATIASLMADDVVFVHSNGLVQTKAQYVNSISSGQMKLALYKLNDTKVVFFEGGAIVCAQTDIAPASAAGAPPRVLHLRICTVWVPKPSGWQMILNQGVTLPPPPATRAH